MKLQNVFRYVLLACLVASCPIVRGELAATIRLETGELRLTNVGLTDFNLIGYTIDQPSAELQSDEWLAVTGRLDTSTEGDSSFDSENPWLILAPLTTPPTSVDELSEGTTLGSGGTLTAGDSLYLGAVWNTSSAMDVEVTVVSDLDEVLSATVTYVPTGDYNEDGIVDSDDYTLWRSQFGTSGIGLLADGNADQVVDLEDYTLWRNNLGATATSVVAPSLAALVTVPEPATVYLLLAGLGGLFFLRR